MKDRIDQLALFGASPAFERKLHVGQPNVGDRAYFMQRVERILDTRWFTASPCAMRRSGWRSRSARWPCRAR